MITAPFFARSLIDRAMYRERQQDRLAALDDGPSAHDEPPGYVTTSMPVDLALPARPFATGVPAPYVTVHVTDVTGGFGVSRQALARWTRLVATGKVPTELAVQRPLDVTDGDWSYTLALLERYSRCAYHRIVSRRVGIVVNHPLSLRTSHGNGGNCGVGIALDCGHGEALSDAFVALAMDAVEDLIYDTYTVLDGDDGPVTVVPHRVWSAGRRVDTDGEVWRRVVRPAVDRIVEDYEADDGGPIARVGYEIAHGGGRPIPRSWDDRALFDDRGRRLPPVIETTKTGPDGKDSGR